MPTNKPFNRNIANRLWGQMLGRALVEPVEFQYAGNPPSNPQLLEMLADGASDAEIVADYPYVALEDVRACLAYAAGVADHPIVLAAE